MRDKKGFRHFPKWAIALVLMLLLTVGILPLGIPAEAVSSPTITFEDFSGGRYTFASASKSEIKDVTYVSGKNNETDTFDFTITSAENKILITSENNKNSELCYVPITSKMLVPANSTYMVKHTFTIEPFQTADKTSATAAACFELLEFGTNLNFQNARFQPATSSTKSNDGFRSIGTNGTSIAKGYRNTSGKSPRPIGQSTYTVKRTVTYKNETNAEKTITNYFGLWVATQYGSKYTNGVSVSCQIDTKVTSYIVNFNANGGLVSPTSRTVTYGGTYGTLPTPNRSGFTFSGWFTAKSGGRQVLATNKTDGSDGSTLYAQWHKTSHQICGNITCSEASHKVVTWTPWNGSSSIAYNTNKVAYVYLTTDITSKSYFDVGKGYTLYLCLNGKSLSSSHSTQTIQNRGTLVICDCGGTGRLVNTGADGRVVYNYPNSSASMTMYSGTLESTGANGTTVDNGSGASMTLYGGTVRSTGAGGTVVLNTDTFTMHNGTLENTGVENKNNGKDTHGLITNGTATIYGGTIKCTNGYGIRADLKADTTMTGGTVTSDKMIAFFMTENGIFTMTGGTLTATNSYGIFTQSIDARIRIGGGTIKGGEYGIYNYHPYATVRLGGNPTISGSIAAIYTDGNHSSIYANGWTGIAPYSGNGLKLKYKSLNISETAVYVYGVNDNNENKFRHVDTDVKFVKKTFPSYNMECLITRSINDYEVTFDPRGGEVDSTSQVVTKGNPYGTLPTPTRTGYTFDGWYTAKTGGTKVSDSTVITATSDYTLYARWNLIHNHKICTGTSCTNTSHTNIASWAEWNGTDSIPYTNNTAYACLTADSTGSLTVGEGKTLYLCLNGKTLTGTITVQGTLHICDCIGTGKVVYKGGSVIKIGSDGKLNYYGGTVEGGSGEINVPIYADGIVNLYAMPQITTGCPYGIRGYSAGFLHICAKLCKPSATVRVNFGTGNDDVSMTAKAQVQVTTGWSDYMSGADPTNYFVPRTERCANIVLDGNELVLRRLRIKFDGVDGYYYAKYYGGTLEKLPPNLTRTGYTFNGWFTDVSGGTKITTSYKFTDDTTVHAQWTANKYTVSFNINYTGGTNPASLTVTYDSLYGTLPTPTRTGYTFLGWYTSASSGTKVENGTKVTRADNHTLYAHWELEQVIEVVITWGALEFTYDDGDWNPETHEYRNGGWKSTDNGDRITVKNVGNVTVSVTFSYTQTDTAVSASFSVSKATLSAGASKKVFLTLSGKPSKTMTKATIGKVTIKLE